MKPSIGRRVWRRYNRILLTGNELCQGGAERQRVLLANELAKRGYPVTLACLQHFGPLTPEAAEALSFEVRTGISSAYVDALVPLFAWIAVLFAVGLVLAVLLPRHKLRGHRVSVASGNADDAPVAD